MYTRRLALLIVCVISFVALGVLAGIVMPIGIAYEILLFVVMALSIIACLTFYITGAVRQEELEKSTAVDFVQTEKELTQLRKRAQHDRLNQLGEYSRKTAHAELYLSACMAANALALFSLSALLGYYGTIILWAVLSPLLVLFAYSLLCNLCFIWGTPDILTNPLCEDEFPELWEDIHTAAALAKINKKVFCQLDEEAFAAVRITKHRAYLTLGAWNFLMLTRQERINVLLHEFGHVVSPTIAKWSRAQEKLAKWIFLTQDTSFYAKLCRKYYYWISCKIANEQSKYTAAASVFEEQEADALVVKCGDAQTFINALAKINLLSLFDDGPQDFFVYSQDKPCTNYYELRYARFLSAYAASKELWNSVLPRRTPARFATHPTFPERMRNCGVEQFFVQFDYPLSGEREQLMQYASDVWLLNEDEREWKIKHKTFYLEPKQAAALAQQRGVDTLTARETSLLIQNLRMLGKHDQAYEIIKASVNRFPRNAIFRFYLGCAQLERYDDQGIEALFDALNRDAYVSEAKEMLRNYLLTMGFTEQLDRLRDIVKRRYDFIFNLRDRLIEPSPDDNLLPATVTDEVQATVTALCKANSMVKRVYIVNKELEGYITAMCCILLDNTDDDGVDAVCDDFFYEVADVSEQRCTLCILNDAVGYESKVEKIPDSLVYQRD